MPSEDILRQLFVKKSLKNNEAGFELQLLNPLSNATIIEPARIVVKGENVEKERYKDFEVEVNDSRLKNKEISKKNPLDFPVNTKAIIYLKRDQILPVGKYTITFTLLTQEFGELKFKVKEKIRE